MDGLYILLLLLLCFRWVFGDGLLIWPRVAGLYILLQRHSQPQSPSQAEVQPQPQDEQIQTHIDLHIHGEVQTQTQYEVETQTESDEGPRVEVEPQPQDQTQDNEEQSQDEDIYEPDPNLARIDDYKEYLRDFLADVQELPPSFIEWISLHQSLSPYVYEEKSPIFGRTFQLNLYTGNLLKALFADVLDTPATEKVMAVCTFIDKDGHRNHVTYPLLHSERTLMLS